MFHSKGFRGIAALCLLAQISTSQYIQDFTWRVPPGGGDEEAWWRPTLNDVERRVWDLPPYIV